MLHFLNLAFQYAFLGAIFLFGALWVICGIADIPRELREGGVYVPSKYVLRKRFIRFFIAIEKGIALVTGLKLPMYRRRLIREAKVMQYLLDRQHESERTEVSAEFTAS